MSHFDESGEFPMPHVALHFGDVDDAARAHVEMVRSDFEDCRSAVQPRRTIDHGPDWQPATESEPFRIEEQRRGEARRRVDELRIDWDSEVTGADLQLSADDAIRFLSAFQKSEMPAEVARDPERPGLAAIASVFAWAYLGELMAWLSETLGAILAWVSTVVGGQ